MTWPLAAAFVWMIVSNLVGALPSRDHHWRAAYVLIACGIPLLGLVTLSAGPLWGMAVLLMGCSVLRWPLIHVLRWLWGKGSWQ